VTLLLVLVASHPTPRLSVMATWCLSTAVVTTLLELFTPCGLDNITIPVGTALFFAGAFG
jgi:dolichol kinase